MDAKAYVCIDLKSFYASVECADRGLDPFKDHLVVADPDRTDRTICLAITPSMKALGIRNRCRVFEIPNGIEYVMAKPRMRRYMEVSAQIYGIYLQHVAPADVHVYSVDECFIDATPYLTLYNIGLREFAQRLMDAVREETGICATAGVGTNLFLAKVALDVLAKHAPDNIGFLDESAWQREMWFHQPITDIWNVGPGIARRLEKYGVRDMAGVCALDPATLFREFGKNAEFLIDHAWGQEPCTIAEIQAYEPQGHSMVNGQVLPCDYTTDEGLMIMREMVDASVLELVEKRQVCERIGLHIGYSNSAVAGVLVEPSQEGGVTVFDGGHGRRVIGRLRGQATTGVSRKLGRRTASRAFLMEQFCQLFEESVLRGIPIRRVTVSFEDLAPRGAATFTLFDDVEAEESEQMLQEAVVAVRDKFGKNACLKGTSLMEKATMRERNQQVGGHHE